MRTLSAPALVFLLMVLGMGVSLAQGHSDAVRGKGTSPVGETAQGFELALEAAVGDAVLNACARIRGRTWVSLRESRLRDELLVRAWDFIREYQIVAKGKGSGGYFVVVDAQVVWDRLENAIALMDLPKLPAVEIRTGELLRQAGWMDDFVSGLRHGFESKGLEVIGEPIEAKDGLSVFLELAGESKVKLTVSRKGADVAALLREFELTEEAVLKPYDAGVALSNLVVQGMVDEGVVPEIYEFVLVASGMGDYSVVANLKQQLRVLGAVVVTEREARRGQIAFEVVALRPKKDILTRLVAMGFRVGAE